MKAKQKQNHCEKKISFQLGQCLLENEIQVLRSHFIMTGLGPREKTINIITAILTNIHKLVV